MNYFDEFGDTDITKCFGKNCSEKLNCIRFLIKANHFGQLYANFEEQEKIDGKCEYFLMKEVNNG